MRGDAMCGDASAARAALNPPRNRARERSLSRIAERHVQPGSPSDRADRGRRRSGEKDVADGERAIVAGERVVVGGETAPAAPMPVAVTE